VKDGAGRDLDVFDVLDPSGADERLEASRERQIGVEQERRDPSGLGRLEGDGELDDVAGDASVAVVDALCALQVEEDGGGQVPGPLPAGGAVEMGAQLGYLCAQRFDTRGERSQCPAEQSGRLGRCVEIVGHDAADIEGLTTYALDLAGDLVEANLVHDADLLDRSLDLAVESGEQALDGIFHSASSWVMRTGRAMNP